MKIQITNAQTKETTKIFRTVDRIHPEWIHEQIGTKSEAELQNYLDTLRADNYYDANGNHLGPDVDGVSIYRD